MSAICLEVLKFLNGIQDLGLSDQTTNPDFHDEFGSLMDGLHPFTSILITASLSSKTNKDALWLEMCE